MQCTRSERNSWEGMISRCHRQSDQAFVCYGGRGIAVCQRWRESFEAFLADMGPRPDGTSIDRIDNDGDYEPGNCRWATPKEQSRNTRTVKRVVYEGQEVTMRDLAERLGLSANTLWQRIDRGWPENRWHEPPGHGFASNVADGAVAQHRDSSTAPSRDSRACTLRQHEANSGESTCMARATDGHGIRCNLALEMAARKLTVRGLAEATGIHTSSISKLRAGHFTMVDCLTLDRLCRYLRVNPGDLLFLDPPLEEEEP